MIVLLTFLLRMSSLKLKGNEIMIKIVRLTTGEDLIADVEKKENHLLLKQPHRLLLTKEGLGSMPICPFSKNTEYEIPLQHILFEAEPENQIRDSYAEQVGAILLPTKNILTP